MVLRRERLHLLHQVVCGRQETVGGASAGTWDVKESLNVPLKLQPPFHWLPGLMKGRFLRRRVLVRLQPLNSLLLSAAASWPLRKPDHVSPVSPSGGVKLGERRADERVVPA